MRVPISQKSIVRLAIVLLFCKSVASSWICNDSENYFHPEPASSATINIHMKSRDILVDVDFSFRHQVHGIPLCALVIDGHVDRQIQIFLIELQVEVGEEESKVLRTQMSDFSHQIRQAVALLPSRVKC